MADTEQPPADARPAECPGCLEPQATPALLPCLHRLCGPCAEDLASDAAPRCPTCFEVLDADAVRQAMPEERPAKGLLADFKTVRATLRQARHLLERAGFALAEARDFAAFASENKTRVQRDIVDAYANYTASDGRAPDAVQERRDALLKEARVRLAAERKSAYLVAETALELHDRLQVCVSHCESMASSLPESDLKRVQARLKTLRERCDAYVPALASATYFAYIPPLNERTEPHACLGRSLLWHERWAEESHKPPMRQIRLGHLKPAVAMPDGERLVLLPRKSRGFDLLPHVAPLPWLDRGGFDLQRAYAYLDIARAHIDPQGRVWGVNVEYLCCWGPDGKELCRIDVVELARKWHFEFKGDGVHNIDSMLITHGGALIVLLRANTQFFIVAATAGLEKLWQTSIDRDLRCCQLRAVVLIYGDKLCLEGRLPTNVAIPVRVCIDAHTGQQTSAEDMHRWLPRFADAKDVWHWRADAIAYLWRPEHIHQILWESVPPSVPPVQHVWRVCDLPQRCTQKQPPVVGARGLIYIAERKVILEC